MNPKARSTVGKISPPHSREMVNSSLPTRAAAPPADAEYHAVPPTFGAPQQDDFPSIRGPRSSLLREILCPKTGILPGSSPGQALSGGCPSHTCFKFESNAAHSNFLKERG